jgi:hypothetical protein
MNEQEVNKKSYDRQLIEEKKRAEEKFENLKSEAREFWKSVYLNSLNEKVAASLVADVAYESFEKRFITKEKTL